MEVREYRKQYEQQLAAQARTDGSSTPPAVDIPALLATLRNEQASPSERLAALQELLAVRFLAARFAPYNAEFLAALRAVARPASDPSLREAVLEVLALDKDPEAQALLRRGLADQKAALVPPAKALQFLAYDPHSQAAELARDVFQRTTDTGTKEEALRVLASDPKSADLFAALLKDKSQPRSIRALSATGLNFVNPQSFMAAAHTIASDDKDFDDIRATVIGALAHAADPADVRKNEGLVRSVQELGQRTASPNVRSAVGRLIEKLQE
jgi:hypothetical protein